MGETSRIRWGVWADRIWFGMALAGLLLAASLKAPNAEASDPPDEIYVAKYLKIYQDAKAISDAKRARANELLSRARSADADVAAIQRQIQGTTEAIRSKRELLARLQRENPELAAMNDALAVEINRHQSELNGNILLVQQVTQDLRNTEAQLRQERSRLDSLQQQLSTVTNDLSRMQQQVQSRESELNRASLELRQALDRRNDGQRRYEFVTSELQRIRFEIQQRQVELQQTQAQTPQLQSRVNQIQNVYNQRQREAAPLQARVNDARRRLDEQTRVQRAAQTQVAQIDGELRQLEERLAALRAELAKIDAEIARLESLPQSTEIQAQIDQRKREKASVTERISNYTNQQASTLAERGRAQAQVDQATQGIQVAQNDLNIAQGELNVLLPELRRIERDLEAANAALAANVTLGRSLEQRLNDLSRNHGELDRERVQLMNELAELNRRIPQLQSQVSSLENDLNRLRTIVFNLTRERESVASDVSRQQQTVNGIQANYQVLERRQRELIARNAELDRLIRDKQATIARNQTTIQQNVATIGSLQAEIPSLETELARHQRDLPPAQARASDAWAAFRPVDADATAAEATTAAAQRKYAEVQRTYDTRMAAARESGTQQGNQQGRTDGETMGATDGRTAGTSEGTAAGRAEGLAHGLQLGRDEGTRKGDADGYAHGFNQPENYQAGYAPGLLQGEKDAWDFARRTEYPRGRAARKAELLAQIPANTVEIDNRAVAPRPSLVLGGEFSDDAIFFDVAENLGERSLFAQVVVRPREPSCENGWVDFNEACLASFNTAYQASYDAAYRQAYKIARDAAYTTAYASAFEQNRRVRYQEGYNAAYPIAYSAGDRRGADDARAKGYSDGKLAGYARVIEVAKATEFQKGRDDEQAFFAGNPVVRMLQASLAEVTAQGDAGDVVPGDTLSLDLDAANFGAKDSVRGPVKIRLTALTPNIAVQGGLADLAAIPAQTRARVKSVALAKVAPDAAPNTEAKLQVTATLADGEVQETVLTTKVTQDLPFTIEKVKTEDQPKIDKRYDVEVKVKNTSDIDAYNEIKVVLSSPDAAWLKFDVAEIVMKKLKKNQTDTKKLKYTIVSPEAKGKEITLKVTVFHGRNVSSRGSIVVKVKP